MRKLLKLIIGVISSIILLMYLTLPFVKIGDDKYKVFEYIKYIFDNISMTFKNVELTDVDMLYTVVAWLLMFIIVIVPIISLVVISILIMPRMYESRMYIMAWKSSILTILTVNSAKCSREQLAQQ
jgi:hypothetical protein